MPLYRGKPVIVEAVKLTQEMTVGEETGAAGDYLIQPAVNGKLIISAQEFEQGFEPARKPRERKNAGRPKGSRNKPKDVAAGTTV